MPSQLKYLSLILHKGVLANPPDKAPVVPTARGDHVRGARVEGHRVDWVGVSPKCVNTYQRVGELESGRVGEWKNGVEVLGGYSAGLAFSTRTVVHVVWIGHGVVIMLICFYVIV